jgi:RHS repeat-associated protein
MLSKIKHYNQSEYHPFGMQMPGRNFSSASGYRFGFNGKEKDNELKGDGNSLDFGARMFDSRIGRWFSTDPLRKLYPGLSPFSYGANSAIRILGIPYSLAPAGDEFVDNIK